MRFTSSFVPCAPSSNSKHSIAEFIFSIIKISLIVGLILAGLVIDLGGGPNHDRIGFRVCNDI